MAFQGRKVFTAGEVLTASDVNSVVDQTNMVFAGSAARGSAISSPTEGMVSYLTDTNKLEVFTTYWEQVWPVDIPPAGTVFAKDVVTEGTAVTTSMTATSSLANGVIYVSGGTVTITIDDVLDLYDRIDIWRNDGGTVTIAAGSGVTSWAGAGTAGTAVTFKIDQQYNAATVQKVAANTYRVVGKITA
jgi:hypothetical protein